MENKETILIVDDLPENIDVLTGILEGDYNLKSTTKGTAAIKIAESDNPPDLILLDVMMPVMDGFEVCRILKSSEKSKSIPVIFVTAKDEIVDETHGFEIGAADYITKPINPAIVRARIKTHLALYDQNRFLERKVAERTSELYETKLEIIRRLGIAAEYKDNETGLHVIRMSKYCQLVALEYGLTVTQANLIMNTAPMHDVGKIGIPDKILLKPAPLDEDEWKIMKNHTIIGAKIIGENKGELLSMSRTAALTHHEKWNGSGYPAGISGENIPLLGRIIAVSDVFDALTNKRPYKDAWTVEDSVNFIVKESGFHFDPSIVKAFLNVIPEICNIKEEFKDIF